jgi:2-oxo-4-hydroxy-4-carboxy-5-ureidoimidazoline decarboxylase
MSVNIAQLDGMPANEAGSLLASCCGARAWVEAMVKRRPFADAATLLRGAEDIWWSLDAEDWLDAFAHHPRIGERDAAAGQDERARSWSTGEQSGVAAAAPDVRTALAEGNREYEGRFGYIYLVSAAGKSADDLLAFLQARLANDPGTELRVAAGEQAKITRLRLLKLLGLAEAHR